MPHQQFKSFMSLQITCKKGQASLVLILWSFFSTQIPCAEDQIQFPCCPRGVHKQYQRASGAIYAHLNWTSLVQKWHFVVVTISWTQARKHLCFKCSHLIYSHFPSLVWPAINHQNTGRAGQAGTPSSPVGKFVCLFVFDEMFWIF